MADTYHTLSAPSEASLTEKRSRFLSFAIPVTTAEEAREAVKRFSKEYFDARHVCWAYMLGADRLDFLSNDNGEPSGTAGKPILGQINSFNLTDLLIVVVRYFGGIKLGTPGLIAAYKEAARLAIEAGEIIECHKEETIGFTFPYLAMNDVMKVVKTPGITIVSQVFDNSCEITLSVRADSAPALSARLAGISGVSLR